MGDGQDGQWLLPAPKPCPAWLQQVQPHRAAKRALLPQILGWGPCRAGTLCSWGPLDQPELPAQSSAAIPVKTPLSQGCSQITVVLPCIPGKVGMGGSESPAVLGQCRAHRGLSWVSGVSGGSGPSCVWGVCAAPRPSPAGASAPCSAPTAKKELFMSPAYFWA